MTDIKYWKEGTKIIEACLEKVERGDPADAPFPLVDDEARLWRAAQLEAFRHSLEMMGYPQKHDDTAR